MFWGLKIESAPWHIVLPRPVSQSWQVLKQLLYRRHIAGISVSAFVFCRHCKDAKTPSSLPSWRKQRGVGCPHCPLLAKRGRPPRPGNGRAFSSGSRSCGVSAPSTRRQEKTPSGAHNFDFSESRCRAPSPETVHEELREQKMAIANCKQIPKLKKKKKKNNLAREVASVPA